jgi:hypothetical protein
VIVEALVFRTQRPRTQLELRSAPAARLVLVTLSRRENQAASFGA